MWRILRWTIAYHCINDLLIGRAPFNPSTVLYCLCPEWQLVLCYWHSNHNVTTHIASVIYKHTELMTGMLLCCVSNTTASIISTIQRHRCHRLDVSKTESHITVVEVWWLHLSHGCEEFRWELSAPYSVTWVTRILLKMRACASTHGTRKQLT